MVNNRKTLEEIRQIGMTALKKALGPVDSIRFLRLFDHGRGNYTAARARLLGKPSVKDLVQELRTKRRKTKRP